MNKGWKPAVPRRSAYTIPEFCADHGFCVATYYNLKKLKKAPRTMHVLGRELISAESAAEFRRQMEVEEV